MVKDLLDTLVRQVDPPPFEVLLVDNGPTDGLADLVANDAARLNVRLVLATARHGTAYARNVGARAADGANLLFIDHDDTVDEHYVRAMSDALREHRFVCAKVDFKLLNRPSIGWPFNEFQQSGTNWLPAPNPVLFGSGGSLGLRREVYDAVGPFAEDIPCCDDLDFCIRAHLAGITLRFVPEAVLHYRLRDCLRSTFRQRVNWGRAEAFVFKKHSAAIGWATPPLKRQLNDWWLLLWNLRWAPTDPGRMWLATYAGVRVGRLIGSLEHHVWFP
jgi:GT2 family glycosyltransferase